MKSPEWKTYRTRFLIKAKQLTSTLSFTDHLGRQHCGRKGDYLVESYEGVLSIAPRHIFEDIYVPMGHGSASEPDETYATNDSTRDLNHMRSRGIENPNCAEPEDPYSAQRFASHASTNSRSRSPQITPAGSRHSRTSGTDVASCKFQSFRVSEWKIPDVSKFQGQSISASRTPINFEP